MVTRDMNKLLLEITNLQAQIAASPSTSRPDLARSILINSSLDSKPGGQVAGSGSSGGPSVVSRIFDVLSRPNYAVAESAKRLKEGLHDDKSGLDIGHILGGIGGGLTGQDKTTFTSMIADENRARGEDHGIGETLLGLGMDIGLDPTSYVGAGLISKIGKLFNKGEDVAKVAAEAPKVAGTVSVTPGAPLGQVVTKGEDGKEIIKNAHRENVPEQGQLPTILGGEPAAVSSAGVPIPGPAAGTHVNGMYVPRIRPVGPLENALQVPGAKSVPKSTPFNVADAARAGMNVPNQGEQGYKKAFAAFMKAAKDAKGPVPKKADFPNMQEYAKARAAWSAGKLAPVQPAENIIERMAQGDIPSAVRATPNPPSAPVATGMQTAVAVSAARQFISRVKTPDKYLNPTQQLRIFHNLLKRTVGSPVDRLTQATTMMREAEKYFRSQGYGMKHWDGTKLSLSRIIDEMGGPSRINVTDLQQWSKNAVSEPGLAQAIENVRANSVMGDTPIVDLALSQGVQKFSIAEKILSPGKLENFKDAISDETARGLKAMETGPGSIRATQDLLNGIMNGGQSPAQTALNANKTKIQLIVAGKPGQYAWAPISEAMTKKLETVVGISAKQAGTKLGNGNKAVEFFGLRFATFFGMKDLRQPMLDQVLTAEANASHRHRVWSDLVQKTTADDRIKAFQVAQARREDPNLDGVAARFRDSMERLFSSSGIKDEVQSVALRSGMVMDDLNEELRRVASEFYFTKEGYEEGTDWLKSWESWDVKGDPVNVMARIETAVERLAKKYTLYDEVAARWGSLRPGGEFRFRVDHHRLQNRWFPKEMVPQIQRMMDTLNDMYDPKSPFAKYLDAALATWKKSVTIYSPAHHIRNGIGDGWLSWIAGVNDPKVYGTAARVMEAQRGRYKTMADVEQLVGKLPQKATKQPVLLTTKGGKNLTADDIYLAAHNRGLLLTARQIEDIYGEALLPSFKPFGGRVSDFASGVSEHREHYFRLAHFIDAVKKSKMGDLKDVFDEAAHTVRKWHPDGMDLTNFERKYLRRIFPFYSWTRKAVPLVVESIVMKPGKVLVYPKGMEALQAYMGVDAPSRTDPFPTDQLFPDWVKEKGIGPIAQTGMEGIPGLIAALSRQGVESNSGLPMGGYSLVNPSNPMIDTVAQIGGGNPLQSMLEMANPAIRIPMEIGMNQNVSTGAPVYGGAGSDPARYATEQIPIVSILSRLSNIGVAGPTNRGDREGLGNLEGLINQLTAAGLLGTGPYIKQAQFEQARRKQ